jgi:hypothetical protein
VDLGTRLSLGATERTGPGWRFLGTIQEAARAAAGERTLATLVGSSGDSADVAPA